jgi:putative hydrolase of the HAD superfamily
VSARPIRAFLFDLGNVLVSFSHARMVRQLAEVAGVDPSTLRRALIDDRIITRLDRGEAGPEEFIAWLAGLSGRTLDAGAVWRAGSDIFWPNPEAERLTRELKALGHRLVLISNTCQPHIDWLRANATVLEPFDRLTLSCDLKTAKPDPMMFRAAVANAGFAPDECFYTDDIDEYVHAARELGIRGIPFRNIDQLREALIREGALPA